MQKEINASNSSSNTQDKPSTPKSKEPITRPPLTSYRDNGEHKEQR